MGMSLLHPQSEEDLDAAAKGESYTRGTSHIVWASITAIVVITVAAVLYIYMGQKPPAATGEVLSIWTHSMHDESPGYDAAGVAMPQETNDHILVFTRVRIHNQGKIPLYLIHTFANATLNDGIHTSYAAMRTEYNQVFLAYPKLAAWRDTPLAPDLTLDPGQTVEGTIITSFRVSRQQWDARKDLTFGFGFRYQPVLTLTPKVPIVEH